MQKYQKLLLTTITNAVLINATSAFTTLAVDLSVAEPTTPIYEALPVSLITSSQLDTMQQRIGNRNWGNDNCKDHHMHVIDSDGLWMKEVITYQVYKPKTSISNMDFDAKRWSINLGYDTVISENKNGKLIFGFGGYYTYNTIKIGTNGDASKIGPGAGNGKIKSNIYGPLATLTWQDYSGAYVDTQFKANFYDNELHSDTLNKKISSNNAKGFSASI
ncbi:MAG: hypothetical protein DGJ47_000632, partial [Rickettsiaceae bacterium]